MCKYMKNKYALIESHEKKYSLIVWTNRDLIQVEIKKTSLKEHLKRYEKINDLSNKANRTTLFYHRFHDFSEERLGEIKKIATYIQGKKLNAETVPYLEALVNLSKR